MTLQRLPLAGILMTARCFQRLYFRRTRLSSNQSQRALGRLIGLLITTFLTLALYVRLVKGYVQVSLMNSLGLTSFISLIAQTIISLKTLILKATMMLLKVTMMLQAYKRSPQNSQIFPWESQRPGQL